MKTDKLFYDDTCPICRHEMNKLNACQDGSLELVPISRLPAADQPALLTQLHLRTADGVWMTGLEANVRAWQHTAYGRWAKLLLYPPLRWFAELGYRAWLLWYKARQKRVRPLG